MEKAVTCCRTRRCFLILSGEIRLILSPVDAELGRGNSQIQIHTRSGTNKYTGSAAWYVRNTALDANTWSNNHTPFTDPGTGVTTNSTQKPWRNNHQYSIAYGGPVKIPGLYDGKNKTFFYALWAQNISNTRQVLYTPVLTDTARHGNFPLFSRLRAHGIHRQFGDTESETAGDREHGFMGRCGCCREILWRLRVIRMARPTPPS